MFVQIRCSNPGHTGRSRAGRYFANGGTYRMEVVGLPRPDPKTQKPGEPRGWPLDEKGQPSMEAIDKIDLERVKSDPTMSVLEGGDTGAALSEAAFQEARAQLKAATSDLADAKIQIAAHEETIANLTAQLKAATPDDDAKGNGKKK